MHETCVTSKFEVYFTYVHVCFHLTQILIFPFMLNE